MLPRSLTALLAAVALGAAGCGGDDGGNGGGSGGGGSGGDSANAEAVQGNGYELTPPESWSNETETARKDNSAVDLAVAAPPEDGFATNLNVIRQEAPSGAELDEIAEQARNEIKQVTGGRDPGPFEDSTLADEPSKTITYDAAQQGRDLTFRQEVALHDGGLYVVTFTSTQEAAEKDAPTGDAIIESWRWR